MISKASLSGQTITLWCFLYPAYTAQVRVGGGDILYTAGFTFGNTLVLPPAQLILSGNTSITLLFKINTVVLRQDSVKIRCFPCILLAGG